MIIGITELPWKALSEDQKVAWKYFSRLVAIVAAYFILKTGNATVDWVLTALTASFLIVVIETQRSYSGLSPKFRKRSTRVAICLGSSAVVVLGIAFFAHVALASAARVFSQEVLPVLKKSMESSPDGFEIILVFSFIIAVPISVIWVFRALSFEDLIYHMPRYGLIQLLVYKRYKAESFAQFAHLELSALLACFIYASAVASILKVVVFRSA